MKTIATVSFFILSLNVFANSNKGTIIEVPCPDQQQTFYGGIDRVEADLKLNYTHHT
jgi:hypothetical protein